MAAIELKLGQLIDERYQIISVTGSVGGMATIYPAIDLHTKKKVAIKVAANEDAAKEALNRECKILRKLHPHPNIVPFICETLVGERHGLIVEWLENSLRNKLDTFKDLSWIGLMEKVGSPLLNALHHSHNSNFQHRDVHPGNIMFSLDGQLRLIDFGIAQLPMPSLGKTFFRHGTPPYTPEEHNDINTGFARDCYSVMVVMLSCIVGKEFASYSELNNVLATLDAKTHPVEIIKECLVDYPKFCPRNAGTLSAKLRNWMAIQFPEASLVRLAA